MTPSDPAHFDRWADSYDDSVSAKSGFPFEGYEGALDRVIQIAATRPELNVWDIGTGTGRLAGELFEQGCQVWATDFSERMLELAAERYPGVELELGDLRESPPLGFPLRFDRIVSAYALHHLGPDEKVDRIRSLVDDHLEPDGLLIVADVAFDTADDQESVREQVGDRWDASEHYWIVDQTLAALEQRFLRARFERVSFCAGVFTVFEP
ncbi:MAG: class I SAM-dependent methyltransferase [Planctomycetota bacterium]